MTLPVVTLSDAALTAIRQVAGEGDEGDVLRVAIDASFRNDLYFAALEPGDVVIVSGGLQIAMDARTARRADGLKIDYIDGPGGAGFKLDNPNQASPIKGIHPADLVRALEQHEKLQLIDARPEAEQAQAKVAIARRLDAPYQAELEALAKDAKLVFLGHHSHGGQAAARLFHDRGFLNLWYVVGGIDAWATMDPAVPRY